MDGALSQIKPKVLIIVGPSNLAPDNQMLMSVP